MRLADDLRRPQGVDVALVDCAILLRLAGPGAHPRRQLDETVEPPANPLRRERRHLDVAERREDEGAGVIALVDDALPLALEVLEVGRERGRDGERPGDAGVGMGAPHVRRARLVLRLLEIENGNAVGVAVVVGGPDRLGDVGLPTDIVADHPGAGGAALPAASRLAIAEMQAGLDQAIVRLAAGPSRLRAAAILRFESMTVRAILVTSLGRRFPTRVQYLSNIHMKTGADEQGRMWPHDQAFQGFLKQL